MGIRRFTPAYDLARESAKNYRFAPDWQRFLNDKVGLKTLLGSADGPEAAHGPRLDVLRAKVAATAKKDMAHMTEGDVLLEMAGIQGAAALSDAQADALATLKMLRHLYFLRERGNQAVWIYAQPFEFHRWVFDEIRGCTPTQAVARLNYADEVYSTSMRTHMGAGLQQAQSWAQKCVAKLGGASDDSTKGLIKRWFMPGAPDDAAIQKVATTLLDGFKKISALCGSTRVIFSDEPINRMSGDAITGQPNYTNSWLDYAFVDAVPRERLDVVYIQNGALEKWASPNEGWMATLTILHEMSHRVINTKDAVYDFQGLKPGAVLTQRHALVNADSWAYFATDVAGQLRDSVVATTLKEPPALRAAYLRTLQNP
jgi:hypothetical protein